jgi:bifunctional non-homologous end joining protein LigD
LAADIDKRPKTRPPEGLLLDPSGLSGARRVAEMPRFVQPELATLVEQAPQGDDWLHEIKFDGYRALARIERGKVEMRSRNDKDWTEPYRVLVDELAKLPVENAMLDGEVVVRLPDGTTSFEELRRVLGSDDMKDEHRGTADSRLAYYVFDLLYLNGFDLLDTPIEERRHLLERLFAHGDGGGRIRYSEHIPGDGPAVLAEACRMGLEGVVSKRATTRYRPGARGADWVKSKCRHEQEFVIGGYTDPGGTRIGFGALLLGVQSGSGLRYVSKVGTGFDDKLLRSLGERLRGMEVESPQFTQNLPTMRRGIHWVRPELVAEVTFMEWTSTGGIRHPSFAGLREDKSAAEVVAEMPAGEDR